MNQAYRYNLIRFQPDAETEEFAVIGIVVYSPTTCDFAYRLLTPNQYPRIHAFFNQFDERILPAAVQMIETEMRRVKKLLPKVGQPNTLYEELVREREDIVRFAPAGTVAGLQAQNCTDELFKRYVERHYPVAA